MARHRWAIFLLLPTLALAFPALAAAHGLAGQRFFPATLAVDDPFVADELSFVTVSHIKLRGSEEGPPTRETDFGAEFSKRLTPDFGVSFGGTLKVLDPDEGRTVSGFDNLEVALKYVFFKVTCARPPGPRAPPGTSAAPAARRSAPSRSTPSRPSSSSARASATCRMRSAISSPSR